MRSLKEYTSIGGQAVIEGVMMRSPHFIAVALRRMDNRIVIRSLRYQSWSSRIPFLKKPILRGVGALLESMFQGIDALSFSAAYAESESNRSANSQLQKKQGELTNLAIVGSIAVAFTMAIGLFIATPHLLALFVVRPFIQGNVTDLPIFHLLDGLFKVIILLAYVYLISLMNEIRRVFQYHGAEHQSIYAFEAGEALLVENARKHSPLHPRCGTSFLLFLVLVSVCVFSIIFPVIGMSQLSNSSVLNHLLIIFLKIFLMLPVAGISYELIKFSACKMSEGRFKVFFKVLVWPGLMLQKLTTRKPDDLQLEVALAALTQVLRLEKGQSVVPESLASKLTNQKANDEIIIDRLSDLGRVLADVSEFPE